jgi:anti-anti-sigma factor
VRHGAGHGRLRLWATAGSLYCQVKDGGPALASAVPASGQAQWPAQHGHGLWIVRQVASQLSIQHGPGETTVTARFAIAAPGRPAHAAFSPAALSPLAAGDGASAGTAADLSPLNILVREQGAWTTVRVEGELDYLSSVDLIMVLGGILGTGKHRIAVDLSNVTLCDSSGLRCVVRASSQVHERGGQLVIVHQGPLHGSPGLRALARVIPVLPDPPR